MTPEKITEIIEDFYSNPDLNENELEKALECRKLWDAHKTKWWEQSRQKINSNKNSGRLAALDIQFASDVDRAARRVSRGNIQKMMGLFNTSHRQNQAMGMLHKSIQELKYLWHKLWTGVQDPRTRTMYLDAIAENSKLPKGFATLMQARDIEAFQQSLVNFFEQQGLRADQVRRETVRYSRKALDALTVDILTLVALFPERQLIQSFLMSIKQHLSQLQDPVAQAVLVTMIGDNTDKMDPEYKGTYKQQKALMRENMAQLQAKGSDSLLSVVKALEPSFGAQIIREKWNETLNLREQQAKQFLDKRFTDLSMEMPFRIKTELSEAVGERFSLLRFPRTWMLFHEFLTTLGLSIKVLVDGNVADCEPMAGLQVAYVVALFDNESVKAGCKVYAPLSYNQVTQAYPCSLVYPKEEQVGVLQTKCSCSEFSTIELLAVFAAMLIGDETLHSWFVRPAKSEQNMFCSEWIMGMQSFLQFSVPLPPTEVSGKAKHKLFYTQNADCQWIIRPTFVSDLESLQTLALLWVDYKSSD